MTFSKGRRINTLHGLKHSSHGNEALLLVKSLLCPPPRWIFHHPPRPHLPWRQDRIAQISVLHSSSDLSVSLGSDRSYFPPFISLKCFSSLITLSFITTWPFSSSSFLVFPVRDPFSVWGSTGTGVRRAVHGVGILRVFSLIFAPQSRFMTQFYIWSQTPAESHWKRLGSGMLQPQAQSEHGGKTKARSCPDDQDLRHGTGYKLNSEVWRGSVTILALTMTRRP